MNKKAQQRRQSAVTATLKRGADIIVSIVALSILFVPLTIGCCIAAIITRKNPIYSQPRVGRYNREFTIYKLRTMRPDAEADGIPRLASPDDSRVTRVGRTLRKYHLDELPQFWNVLCGDMSLVGPRPERRYFIDRIMESHPEYSLLLQIRPGITSAGMAEYGYATSLDEMIDRMQFDIRYLDSPTLSTDIKIIYRSLISVLSGKGI